MYLIVFLIFLQSVTGLAAAQGEKQVGSVNNVSIIQEERAIVISGVKEKWRLEWVSAPNPVCAPEEGFFVWGVCPCAGFEFGEEGELDLVRLRPKLPEERLHLTPFFQGQEKPGSAAVLRRWPVMKNDRDWAMDADREDLEEFSKRVRSRSPVSVMNIADYNHDGIGAEFVLQVGSGPCGHQQAILIGIDRRNPHLHAFGTVEYPDRPIVLEHLDSWEKLLHSRGEITIIQMGCGDHGSEEQTEIHLRTDSQGIHATQYVYKCQQNNKLGPLISKENL